MTPPARSAHAPQPAPALALRSLAVGHGKRALASNIDLEVLPGELVALIGPNGSGKTTILRTAAGQLKPLAGRVELLGRDLAETPGAERARVLAALFTGRPHTELLTCQDVVEAGRYPFTGRLGALGRGDRAVVRSVMEAAGIWHLRDRDFAHMSDGQRQRALIARALCQEPRVLLLDEPTSYLDVGAQLEMLQLLREQAQSRGIAVLASLHDLTLALRAADRMACVANGTIASEGAPDEILTPRSVSALYGVDATSFSPLFGTVEMRRPEGAPRVFVIAGEHSSAPTYRTLARHGIPFATPSSRGAWPPRSLPNAPLDRYATRQRRGRERRCSAARRSSAPKSASEQRTHAAPIFSSQHAKRAFPFMSAPRTISKAHSSARTTRKRLGRRAAAPSAARLRCPCYTKPSNY